MLVRLTQLFASPHEFDVDAISVFHVFQLWTSSHFHNVLRKRTMSLWIRTSAHGHQGRWIWQAAQAPAMRRLRLNLQDTMFLLRPLFAYTSPQSQAFRAAASP